MNEKEVKECLNILLQTQTYKNKQTQMHLSNFQTLISNLNVELEKKDYETVNSESDKKELAKIIFSSYKNSLIETNNKIGPYDTGQLSSGPVTPTGTPTYTDLNTPYQANKPLYSTVRAEVVQYLGIRDAGHSHHGSNFSGTQTLKQIIKNVFDKVQGGGEQSRVAQNSLKYYHYDPRT